MIDKLVLEPSVNVVRVRHAKKGVETYRTNHVSKLILDNPHWNADWIYVIDNSWEKMYDTGELIESKNIEE